MKQRKIDLIRKLNYANKMIRNYNEDIEALNHALYMLGERRSEAESMSLVEGQLYKDDWKQEQERMEKYISSLDSLKAKLFLEQTKWYNNADIWELKLKEYDHE